MHRRIPEWFSCEKTRLHVLHSAARKPFAKGFDGKERAVQGKGWLAIRPVTTCNRWPRRRNVIVCGLDKQRILVIGGTSGIGLATAAAAVDAGAAVTIASRNQMKLDAVAAKLGGAVQTRVLDIGDNDLLERFFQKEQAWDHVRVSAAQTKTGPVRGSSLADAAAAMESKFWV